MREHAVDAGLGCWYVATVKPYLVVLLYVLLLVGQLRPCSLQLVREGSDCGAVGLLNLLQQLKSDKQL